MAKLKNQIPEQQFYTLYHEKFVKNKREEIPKLCSFLGQKISSSSLKACSAMIYDSPHKRRHSFDWSQEDKKKVNEGIKKYRSLLGHYRF